MLWVSIGLHYCKMYGDLMRIQYKSIAFLHSIYSLESLRVHVFAVSVVDFSLLQ